MTFSELISPIFPGWALRRERNRAALQALQSRKFDGASRGRRAQGWNTSSNVNSDIAGALAMLRSRSRDLAQNSEYGRRAMQAIRNNTVGSGIRLRIEGISRKERSAKILKAWRMWAEGTGADFYGQQDFHGLQTLVMETVAKSGDCLILRRNRGPRFPLSLQILDGEHLDVGKVGTPGMASRKENIIRYGVEFTPDRQVAGYWILDSLPGDTWQTKPQESKFYPVEDVCHIYQIEHPGQIRGVPWLSCGMIGLRDMDQFEEAQLIRQKIAACFSVFVHDFSGEGPADLAGVTPDSERVEPGIIQYLPQGKTVSFGQPPATEGYESYMTQRLRRFAASIGLSYEVISGDYSLVNFSSGRMGWIEMSKNVTEWQNRILIPLFCSKVFLWWKDAADIAGVISSREAAILFDKWTTPRREMLDPVKEIKGLALQISAGLISWQEALRSLGFDPDDLTREAMEAKQMLESAGLSFDWNPQPDEPEPSPGEDAD